MRPFFASAVTAAVCLLFLSACGRPHSSMATLTEYSRDSFVRTGALAVSLAPLSALERKPKALFLPLRVRQDADRPVTLGREISRQVHQVWLGLHVFGVQQYREDFGPWDPVRAVALARRLGAEFVVGGYINSYLDGGTEGTSSASLAIEVLDTATGAPLFSLAQSGILEDQPARDFYLFSLKERLPLDPASFVVRTLALNMGLKVADWTDSPIERAARRDKNWWDITLFRSSAF